MAGFESYLRLSIFAAVFLILAVWEIKAPRRIPINSKGNRWLHNLSLLLLNTLLLRLLFPLATVGAALYAEEQNWGLFHWLAWHIWLEVILSIVILDLVIYGQHVLTHKIPVLWRIHRVHHLDLDVDLTTGLRFHPVEILLSMVIKWTAVLILGAPALAALCFEILLNVLPMFNHANIHLGKKADAWIRLCIVTPDMHRIHHSVRPEETDVNFGFNLSLWDRLFATYRETPQTGHRLMQVGLADFRSDTDCTSLQRLLPMPFRRN